MSGEGQVARRDDCQGERQTVPFHRKIHNALRIIFRSTPEFGNLMISLIAVYVTSTIIQKEYCTYLHRMFFTNIRQVSNDIDHKMDQLENALIRMGIDCGFSDLSDDQSKEDDLEEMIRERIKEYDNDRVRKIDWACESLGGNIAAVKGTEIYTDDTSLPLNVKIPKHFSSDPKSIIRSKCKSCWGFKGEGRAVVKLATPVYITHFTVEHPLQELNKDKSFAPRMIVAKGYRHANDNSPHVFGAFEFRANNDPVQTFPVQTPSSSQFQLVEFHFKQNQGNTDFTCVYGVKVHGRLTNDNKNFN